VIPEVLRARLRPGYAIGLMFALAVVLGVACATTGAWMLAAADRAAEIDRQVDQIRRETDWLEAELHCTGGAAQHRDGESRWCQR
jgi:uncharacterized membrane protein YedE/YeeE